MKNKIEEVEKVVKRLEIYNILEHYAKFKCRDGDEYSYFELKTRNENWKKKYTTDFKSQKLEFEIMIHGLEDIFSEMTVIDLITDKRINSFEIFIYEIIIDNYLNERRELLDEYSFGI